jgi:hypothetical protein
MKHVAVHAGYCRLLRSIIAERVSQQIRNKAGIVALEIDNVERRVQWPVRLFQKEHLTNRSISPCHDTGRLRFSFSVSAGYTGGGYDGN